MKTMALLALMMLAQGVGAWDFGWSLGVDRLPISQMVQRGMNLDQELEMDFQGPRHGFSFGLRACRPWRNFNLTLAMERLNHGENLVNWQVETPGLAVDYQGSGAFPAWSATFSLAYPFAKLREWDLSLQSGLSVMSAQSWLVRHGSFQTEDQRMEVTTHGVASGLGLGSLNSLILSRKLGQWSLALEAGFRLAHITAKGSYQEEVQGTTGPAHPLTVDIDYDGPFLKMGLLYQNI